MMPILSRLASGWSKVLIKLRDLYLDTPLAYFISTWGCMELLILYPFDSFEDVSILIKYNSSGNR
jgi:hypothetical protein